MRTVQGCSSAPIKYAVQECDATKVAQRNFAGLKKKYRAVRISSLKKTVSCETVFFI